VKESKEETGRRVDLAGRKNLSYEGLNCIFLIGDGTFDSPGYNAFYCTYFVLDLLTKKVLGLWVATKEMVMLLIIHLDIPDYCRF